MSLTEHVIWQNIDLDYENDWKEFLEEEFPEATTEEREQMMYDFNNEYLNDDRENLNINLGEQILVIANLGLWNGRHMAYKHINSGNIRDCLYAEPDDEYVKWYVDKNGDLCCTAHHHDGTNYYLYRVYKHNATDLQRELLRYKIATGRVKRSDITRVTERLGDAVANVYGFTIRKKGVAA